jgi:hypothetical protein
MVYAAACDGLDSEGRNQLDAALEVASWPWAGQTPAQAQARPAGVPSWWHGEEEASQSFLAGLGINLGGGEQP